jgi:hypothetical protein
MADATRTVFRLILRIKNFFLCKFLIPYKFRSHCSLPVLFLKFVTWKKSEVVLCYVFYLKISNVTTDALNDTYLSLSMRRMTHTQ